MNKIDVHAHVKDVANINFKINDKVVYPNIDELLKLYDSLHIEIGILLPVISPEGQTTLITNEEACMIAQKHPNRFKWVCNVDPRMGSNSSNTDFSEILDYYKAMGAIGVGEVTCNLGVDDSLVDNFFYHCELAKMPVTIHFSNKLGNTYGLVDKSGLPKLEQTLSKYPNLIIIGHAQAFWREITDSVNENEEYPSGRICRDGAIQRLLRNYKNLYCDLSARSGSNALLRDTDYAYIFLEEFQDRIMLGLDVCDINDPIYTEKIIFLDNALLNNKISKTTYDKICYFNARKLYGI